MLERGEGEAAAGADSYGSKKQETQMVEIRLSIEAEIKDIFPP